MDEYSKYSNYIYECNKLYENITEGHYLVW